MSKSKGNVINPNTILEQGYGADALRLSIAFLAPYDQTTPWSPEGVTGTFRFVQRTWTLVHEFKASGESNRIPSEPSVKEGLLRATHYAIKRVSADLQQMGFNTAVAALMEYVNELYKLKKQDNYANKHAWQASLDALVQLVAPYAPHIAEELWQALGHESSVHISEWPSYDEKYLVSDTSQIVIQINGKLRSQIEVSTGTPENEVLEAAEADEKIVAFLEGKPVKKRIYVPGKLVNLVV